MKRGLLALALVLSGLSCSDRDVLIVGAVYPTGGGQGSGAVEEYRGVRLAADLVNERGRTHGKRIELRFQRADSADAAPAAVERLAQQGAPVIVGSYGSTISRPAANAATRLKTVFWETGAVGDLGMSAAKGRYVFRFPPSGTSLGADAVSFVDDKVESRLRYAVAYVDDVYGRAVAAGATGEMKRRGLDVAVSIPYELPSADYREMARRIKKAKADVLFVVAYLDDGVAIRRAVLAEDVPLKANIGTSSSYCHPQFGDALGPDAVGVFASDKPDGDDVIAGALSAEAAKLLVEARTRYRTKYREPMSAAALTGFAGAWALFHGVIPAARDVTADAIAAAATKVRIPLGALPNGSGLHMAGPGSDDPGANLRATSVIWEWVAPRQREIVWPPAFATRAVSS